MSLFMPLTTDQYHAKPMAISSITSPMSRTREENVPSTTTVTATSATATAASVPDYSDINNSPPLTCGSPSISSSHSDTITPPTAGSSSSKSGSSSPPSRTFSNYSSSSNYSFPGSPNQSSSNLLLAKNTRSNSASSLPQPPIMATSFYHPYHYSGSSNSSNSNSNNATQPPLSIHERRLRNKTASAKYRAKKNQQHGEMRAMISTLTKENELLLRQLDHIQHENSHLKATCDRLRGKIMAQKMLKQYLVENEQQQQQQHHRQQQQMGMDQGRQQPPNCFVQYHTASPLVSSTNSKYPEMNNEEQKRGDLNIRSQNETMSFH
ncbi:basic-leucine zipper transcription factor [Mucor lusitanicus]|uniref:Basic-leucine zipper transcription factor n=2 Tax=Mucor circinelloides f. lusitanicus TaxID=29924 RepID=A0A168HHQ5_MUCCL|nr:basic-leucine zipper transcription factor [Mucor lusitanicus CBS 277.49]